MRLYQILLCIVCLLSFAAAAHASLVPNATQATVMGHDAIVTALGMFGGQAKDAIPVLEELMKTSTDPNLKKTIEITIYRILHDKGIMPEDYY